MKKEQSNEILLYKRVSNLLKVKLFLIENAEDNISIKITNSTGKSVKLSNSKNYRILIDSDIQELLNEAHAINSQISYPKLPATLQRSDIESLLPLFKTSNKDYTQIIISKGILMLTNYLNLYAERTYSPLKLDSIITNYHIRFLLPIMETMKWEFSNDDRGTIYRLRGKLSDFAKQYNALICQEKENQTQN
ncbi:MAG: hypothetical protein EOO43_09505 [Flavobacterium sp.]|nr:MAG: hypothetical protein EOO43_09505 [Flavobacterium sp.]